MEDLPNCICGANTWKPRGGQIGPSFSQSGYVCDACRRSAERLSCEANTLFVVAKESGQITDDFYTWINKVCLPYWRHTNQIAQQQAREFYQNWKKGFWARHHVPHDGLDRIEVTESDEADRHFRAMQPGCHIPPSMPNSNHFWMPSCRGWFEINPAITSHFPMPPDPIRVAHDEEFNFIFAELEKLGPKIDRKEIPNRYYNDESNKEPCYEFDYLELKFVIGPRKRVINIECVFPSRRDVRAIRDLAKKDDTTYEADNSWKPEANEANAIRIHAWSRNKAVEYIKVIISSCLGRVAPDELEVLTAFSGQTLV